MDNLHFQELFNKLNRKLLSTRWLTKYNIDKNLVENEMKKTTFINNLQAMVLEEDYSCNMVFLLFEDLLLSLSKENLPKDFLKYLYQYTLNKSFPEAVTIVLQDDLNSSSEFYLRALRVVLEFQKHSQDGTFISTYPMEFLSLEEENSLENPEEYRKFLRAFKHNYSYEMMKLSQEILGFNTLDHICGVHYLSLFIARQLKTLNIPIDLGRVSGAAAGHDIGKYGCKGNELKRVPYLHYYYSDQWFRRYGITYIRNIAVNHSTWDLELENLPLESLVLIYSDFRVKNLITEEGTRMNIFTLESSFNIILEKLDNVDAAKEKRYRRVYAKLKDFEEFLIHLGVHTCINTIAPYILEKNTEDYFSLMMGKDIINNLKYLSIYHNINLMFRLRDEYSLDKILECARSEKDWKNFREYIRVLEEYSTYLTQNQKLQTIKFLYENLVHPEDDIRRHCAELIGTLIAIFDEEYRKELPQNVHIDKPFVTSAALLKQYINLLLNPGQKIIQAHRSWIGYSLSSMIKSLFYNSSKNLSRTYRDIILSYYNDDTYKNTESRLFLLEASKYIPIDSCDENLEPLYDYVISMLNRHNNLLRLAALETAYKLIPKIPVDCIFKDKLKAQFKTSSSRSKLPSENFLKLKISKLLNEEEQITAYTTYSTLDEKKISDILLSNLKTATDWIKKKTQINLLLHHSLENKEAMALHTTIHFCNLLKVSAVEDVRNEAGKAILKLMPYLSLAERNEVSVELLRGLEIEGNRFTEYIPPYLGQLLLYLQPKELDEVINDLIIKIKTSSNNVKSLILKTIGISISHYPKYKDRFEENEYFYQERLKKMLGILLNGLGDYNIKVKQSSFSSIGKDIFGTKFLSFSEKQIIFKYIAKKILTMVSSNEDEDLLFLTNSAALNHIYRFISDYIFFNKTIDIPIPNKVAFFPGTFDPFSLSHKEIARSIRNLGYEVYLSIDEFSWSKKTLPNLLRRNILTMSVADELNIYVYPKEYPTNIANPVDLKMLKENFKDSEVYIVVGSDVILNASSYMVEKVENSIHNFNHIIFERGKNKKVEEASKRIQGKIEWLNLPPKYSDISSTQIRNYIDENRDISSLIDPLAQQYVYANGFYQKEPLNKSEISSLLLDIEVVENITEEIIHTLCKITDINNEVLKDNLRQLSEKPSARIILLKDTSKEGEILGFSAFHWIRSSMLYDEFKDIDTSKYIRENSLGRITVIDGIYVKNSDKNKALEQIILTETIVFCISKDYQYGIFKPMIKELSSSNINELLGLQGFVKLENLHQNNPVFIVNMSNPCILNEDLQNILKEPFRSNLKVKQVISLTRKKLQEALTKLYPGELILAFNSDMLHQKLIRKICLENNVSSENYAVRKLGSAMCVPYGDILERYVIPNTVTKALHTEKLFDPEMEDFEIGQFPYYLDLKTQVKMIKSFNKPVILVDNILHKGYRIKALDPLFKEENIKVQKIVAAILSGRGKDLMDMQNREVESVYFIPNLKVWFNENSLYPFIGGDALWRGKYPERNLLPSINLIMPYTASTFIKDSNLKAKYNLSKICIENSIDILNTLENEYHILHERNLSLSYLGQVFTIPRCPDKGMDMDYNLNLNPSHYLKNDLEHLIRLESIINGF